MIRALLLQIGLMTICFMSIGQYVETDKYQDSINKIENALYIEATTLKTFEAFNKYLKNFPEGHRSNEIKSLKKEMEYEYGISKRPVKKIEKDEQYYWTKTVSSNTINTYIDYLEKHPNGINRQQAFMTLDKLVDGELERLKSKAIDYRWDAWVEKSAAAHTVAGGLSVLTGLAFTGVNIFGDPISIERVENKTYLRVGLSLLSAGLVNGLWGYFVGKKRAGATKNHRKYKKEYKDQSLHFKSILEKYSLE